MKKLLLVTPLPEAEQAALRARFPELCVVDCSQARDRVIEEIRDAHVVFGRVKPEEFAEAACLEFIQVGSHGVELFLYPELVRSDVVVCNTNTLCRDSMTEHILALVLAFYRDLPMAMAYQKEHVWRGAKYWARDLRGDTVGFLGTGSIGAHAARLFAQLGCHTLGYNTSGRCPEAFEAVVMPPGLHEFLSRCDVVVSSLPLTPATEGLMDAEAFAAMKPSALFINVGRGRTVDEPALLAALREGRIAGAGLDVTAEEPLPPDSPVWDTPHLLLTPHRSGDSPSNMERVYAMLAENVQRYLEGRPLLSQVDLRRGY